MSVNINHILKLSNIKMNADQIALLEVQLDNITHWLETISKVDTNGVEPLYNVLQDVKKEHPIIGQHNFARVEEVLSNAPEQFDNFFVVPKVIDN